MIFEVAAFVIFVLSFVIFVFVFSSAVWADVFPAKGGDVTLTPFVHCQRADRACRAR